METRSQNNDYIQGEIFYRIAMPIITIPPAYVLYDMGQQALSMSQDDPITRFAGGAAIAYSIVFGALGLYIVADSVRKAVNLYRHR